MEAVIVLFFVGVVCIGWLLCTLCFKAGVGTVKYAYNAFTAESRQTEEARKAAQKRQQRLAEARADPAPFTLPPLPAVNVAQYKGRRGLERWSVDITRHAEAAQERISKAELLVNSEMEALSTYRARLLTDYVKPCDDLLARYRDDIQQTRAGEPVVLDVQSKLTIVLPFEVGKSKKYFERQVRPALQMFARSISQHHSVGVLGLELVGAVFLEAHARKKARNALLEQQAKLETYLEEGRSAMQVLALVHDHVAVVRGLQEDSAAVLMGLQGEVAACIAVRKRQEQPYAQFSDFTAQEQETLEKLYCESERLKQMVAVAVM